ncbi:MAG: SGNH/GDSL hydrolase family protein [Deltaproteobacteria bacterium]|nr:SGNH/GDSL hydrolase family protein [Deltaproteobacteria bacterium]
MAARRTLNVALTLVSLGLTLLLAEGVYGLWHGAEPRTSLLAELASRLRRTADALPEPPPAPAPLAAGARPPTGGERDLAPLESYLNLPLEVKALLPEFARAGAVLGNTPFTGLAGPSARVTFEDTRGRLRNKPGLTYRLYPLRSRIYNPLDPPTLFHHGDREIPAADPVGFFLRRFSYFHKVVNIDAQGNRRTAPAGPAGGPVVLVAGDSVAFGLGVEDHQSLPSRLQEARPDFLFVNLGIPGADALSVTSRLQEELARWGDRVRGIVYVLCENDLTPRHPPEYTFERLGEILARRPGVFRVLVFSQLVYRILPDLFRTPLQQLAAHEAARRRSRDLAENLGLAWVDSRQLAQEFILAEANPLAGCALYCDHAHFSSLGNRLLAQAVARRLPPGRAPQPKGTTP